MASWPYSTARWQRLRLLQLSTEPCCRYCDRMGVTTPATLVDHITTVAEDKGRAFDQDNLQSLCAPCHNGPKAREDNARIRAAGGCVRSSSEPIGCDVNGIPTRGWE